MIESIKASCRNLHATLRSAFLLRVLCVIAIGLSLTTVVWAQAEGQNSDSGIHHYDTYQGSHESVSLGSGNVFVSVPLLTLPGRNGLNYSVNLISNSQWTYSNNYGWVEPAGTGMVLARTGAVSLHPSGSVVLSTNSDIRCISGYSYTDENGGIHTFSNVRTGCYSISSCSNPTGCSATPTYDVLGGTDDHGAGIDLDITACALTKKNGVWFPLSNCSGATAMGGAVSLPSPVVMEDANGNEITSRPSSASGAWSDTDTLGRSITFTKSGSTETIQYDDSNGTLQTITLNFSSFQMSCPLSIDGSTSSAPTGTDTLITSAVLADGLTYIFQYDGCGSLTKIVYPSGGYTRYVYDYSLTHILTSPGTSTLTGTDQELKAKYVCRAPSDNPGDISTGTGDTCSVAEDETTYAPAVSSSICNNSQNVVTDPLGNKTVYTFTTSTNCDEPAYETERQIYQGSSTLLRTVDTDYTGDYLTAAYPADRTTILPNGLEKKVHMDYSGPANEGWVGDTIEYDWGTGAPGAELRETDTPYGCDWKPASKEVKDGSGNQVALTTYEFDNYTAGISASGAVQHDSNYGTGYTARCNVTAVESWRSNDGATLTTRMQYDDAGNVVSKTDPLGHVTTISFADAWGDSTCAPENLATNPGNGEAYPTSVTTGSLTIKHSYNSCTGTVASTTDPNNQVTSFGYDEMDRKTQVTYPTGGGSLSTCYSDDSGSSCSSSSYPVKTVATRTISSSVNKITTSVLDGLARVSETLLNSDPACTSGLKVDTTYDGDGHVSSSSNPYCSTSAGSTQYQYDALGRALTLTHSVDNSSITTSYDIASGTANCKTVTDEDGKKRTLCYDGLGRNTAVFEDPSGVNYETDYQYNALDDLLQVDQKGGDTNSAHWHTRTFTYNSLSQLLSGTNPETGTVCYGQMSGTTCEYGYDDDGNLLYKTDARGITTHYQYDDLNRLISKTYLNDSTGTPTSCYEYGTSTTGNQKGRLINEWTLPAGSTCSTAPPASGFLTESSISAYDAMGRMTNETQCTPANCSGTAYPLSYTYDDVGDIATFTDSVDPTSYTLTYTYDGADHLRTVGSSLPSDSEHPPTLFSAQPWGPWGLTSASLGNNIQLARSYNSRGFLDQETDQGNVIVPATSGSGQATINFTEQSTAATAATGSVGISGSEQSTKVQTAAATNSTGSISVSGSEQSKSIPGSPGTGSVTINGTEQSTTIQVGCGPNGETCPETIYDGGSIQVTVNGFSETYNYSSSSTGSTIASALASAFNGASTSPVNATASSNVLTLTAKTTGTSTDYSLSASTTGWNQTYFSSPSFSPSTSGSTLTGGVNASTVYDSGTASATVNGCTGSYSWSQGATSSSIASGLGSSLGGNCSAYVAVGVSGSLITLTSKSTGSGVNWPISAGITYNSSQFSSPSFAASASGMSGGKDATTKTVYDSGTVIITVNGHSDSASFGQGDTTSTVASNLAAAIQADSGAYVTATASGSTVSLTTKTKGSDVNYSLSASDTYDTTDFSSSSFTPSASGSTLTGGTGGSGGTPTYDSGTVSLTINGTKETVNYGQNDTASTVASNLASAFSGDSQVTVSASGSTLNFLATTTGSATNYSYSFATTYDTMTFSSPSFQGPSSGTLSGGTDQSLTSGQIYSYTLSFEANGNVASDSDSVLGDWTYGYDTLNRLTSANSTGGKCNGMDIAWAYDPWGNRTSQSASGTGNCTITQPSLSFDYNNRVSTWGYDADGDVTSDGLNTYTYDAEGRVHSVAGVIYVYDAAGQRVAKENSSGQVTDSYVLGPGGVQLAEVNGSGQWQHSNVYALGHIIATYDASGTRFQLDDALGSRRVQANTDGTVGLSCFTYPYGDGLTCSGPDEDATEEHFTGKEYDPESGNYYFGARYDADSYGRFLTPDWSAKVEPVPYAKLDNPQSLNLYAFVLDNPVSAVDADGHQCSGHKEQSCKAQNKTKAQQQKKPSQLPHGGGVGFGGVADAGALVAGASATGSVAGGEFYKPGKGWSKGGTGTYGAVAYAGTKVKGTPKQTEGQPVSAGPSVGVGFFGFVTNATSVNQLSGHFRTSTVNVGLGPYQFSFQLSTGNGIWEFSVSPPFAGASLGLSVSSITTETCTNTGKC